LSVVKSVTTSIAVAAYFAVKGFHERNDYPPRIAHLDAAIDLDLYDATDLIPRSSFKVRNYARKVKEYVYTDAEAANSLTLTEVIQLDINLLTEVEASKRAVRRQSLDHAIQHSLDFSNIVVTFD
jgi:hypothetical protein